MHVVDNTIFEDTCDVLVSATGALNDWKWPSIPGLMNFKGKLLHSASWDESYDWTVSQYLYCFPSETDFWLGETTRGHR